MAYPVTFSSVALVLFRQCNKLVVYDKSTNGVFATHPLRVPNGVGGVTTKYYLLTVSSGSLTIAEQMSAPDDDVYNAKVFNTDFSTMSVLHLHQVWTDDQSAPEIIVGTGDTRDIIDKGWAFDLSSGAVISSPSDNVFTVYYQDGTLSQRNL